MDVVTNTNDLFWDVMDRDVVIRNVCARDLVLIGIVAVTPSHFPSL